MRKLVIVLMLSTALYAQMPPKPDKQIAAIDRLAQMTGNWTGDGWMDMGGRRSTFRGSEVVQKKVGGTALLVEGNFFAKPSGSEVEIPVHTTLGVISFDPQTGKYRFTTWLATGTTGERELVLIDDGWRWEIVSPRGTMRYTTKFTATEWNEIGERSSDGTNWVQFFEMKLKKQ